MIGRKSIIWWLSCGISLRNCELLGEPFLSYLYCCPDRMWHSLGRLPVGPRRALVRGRGPLATPPGGGCLPPPDRPLLRRPRLGGPPPLLRMRCYPPHLPPLLSANTSGRAGAARAVGFGANLGSSGRRRQAGRPGRGARCGALVAGRSGPGQQAVVRGVAAPAAGLGMSCPPDEESFCTPLPIPTIG